jgi:hypothetical protein
MGSGITKGGRDFLELGTWNIMCAYCGRKRKANEVVTDDEFARGLWACPEHRDLRHPQEFARGIKEDMSVPKVQPPIIVFTSLNLTFPVGIIPPGPLVLTPGSLFLITESGVLLTTESGSFLVTETGVYIGEVGLVLPPWVSPVSSPFGVYLESVLWSWLSGGSGIIIDSPTSLFTFLTSTDPSASGVLQVQATNSLGEVGTATIQVST